MTYLSEADFQQIENTLAIQLPTHFKNFHLQQQKLIKELKELVNELDQSISLATDVESILMINQFLEVPKTEGPFRYKFSIGQDGCGNFALIDLKKADNTKVYYSDHDEYDFEEIFDPSINDFKWDSFEGLSRGESIEEYVRGEIAWRKD